MQGIDQAIITRFWAKVDQSGGIDACWPYMGGRKEAGYGNFFIRRDPPTKDGRMFFMNAHKFAFQLVNGDIADGLVVRHTCDNPPCCNPKHLIPGTAKMNVADSIERGHFDPVASGKKFGAKGGRANGQRQAKLTDAEVVFIIRWRAYGTATSVLASAFKVDQAAIFFILEGRTYRWIPLVQRLYELHALGIRFPRTDRKDYSIKLLHPLLRSAIEDERN